MYMLVVMDGWKHNLTSTFYQNVYWRNQSLMFIHCVANSMLSYSWDILESVNYMFCTLLKNMSLYLYTYTSNSVECEMTKDTSTSCVWCWWVGWINHENITFISLFTARYGVCSYMCGGSSCGLKQVL